MNYIDIIILVLLVAFGIGGLRKGIITEVLVWDCMVLSIFPTSPLNNW